MLAVTRNLFHGVSKVYLICIQKFSSKSIEPKRNNTSLYNVLSIPITLILQSLIYVFRHIKTVMCDQNAQPAIIKAVYFCEGFCLLCSYNWFLYICINAPKEQLRFKSLKDWTIYKD